MTFDDEMAQRNCIQFEMDALHLLSVVHWRTKLLIRNDMDASREDTL